METKIYKISSPDDTRLAELGAMIRAGRLVSFPTETVYGLGANAFDADAARRVFEAKGRPGDNPLIVHLTDVSQLGEVAREVPPTALRLFEKFSPGPLTVILKKSEKIPPEVTAGLDTVAVRIPSHPIARALIDAAGVPIAAPSSNLSGRPSPTRAEHVITDLNGRIDAIIDGGACSVGVESTVVELCGEGVNILRPGGICRAELAAVLPEVGVDRHITEPVKPGELVRSPGMKYKHYAPDACVTVISGEKNAAARKIREMLAEHTGEKCGVMCYDGFAFEAQAVLYMGADNVTYAERLFDTLRRFDALGIDVVFAQFEDDDGAGMAVRNRLFKSAAGRVIAV